MYKGLKGKARIPTVDLIPKKKAMAEINIQWPFRLFPLLVKTPIREAFSKLSGTGMTSLILSSLLNCQTTAYLNSLPL